MGLEVGLEVGTRWVLEKSRWVPKIGEVGLQKVGMGLSVARGRPSRSFFCHLPGPSATTVEGGSVAQRPVGTARRSPPRSPTHLPRSSENRVNRSFSEHRRTAGGHLTRSQTIVCVLHLTLGEAHKMDAQAPFTRAPARSCDPVR